LTNNGTISTTNGGSLSFYGSLVNHGSIIGNITGPPAIITPPASQTVNQGDPVLFTVAVTGTPPFRYSWRFNGTKIVSALSNYLLANAQLTNAGNYSVIVSSPSSGSVTSASAVLQVIPPPAPGVSGVKALVNGVIVLRDDFENGPLGGNPIAEFGDWSGISGEVVVTNSVDPGAYQGTNYLQISYAGPANLGSILRVPAAATNDMLHIEAMAYVSPYSYGISNAFTFAASNLTGGITLLAAIGADGTIYSADGQGNNSATQTKVSYGKWQLWEIDYKVGSDVWSWMIDGIGDAEIGRAAKSLDPSIAAISISAGPQSVAPAALFLDGTPALVFLSTSVSNGTFNCTFQTLAGKYYCIDSEMIVAGTWQTVSNIIIGDGTIKTFSDTVDSDAKFYRIGSL
jgi:hypothetical protein